MGFVPAVERPRGPDSSLAPSADVHDNVRRLVRSCLLFAALVPASAASVGAAPFDGSRLEPVGAAPVEGEVYAYRLLLDNAGATASASVDVHVPAAALFAGADGLDGFAFDETGRVLRWQGDIAPGTTVAATLRFVAGRDSGGHTSSLRVIVRPWRGEPSYLSHTAGVDTRPAAAAFRLGRIGVTGAGVVVLAWLSLGGAAWFVLRLVRPRSAGWVPFAVILPLAFLSYFGWLAREDARIGALPQTTCTVLDRTLDARTSSSPASSPRRGARTVYQPRLALGYVVEGQPRVAQGFGTESRLSGARAVTAEALLARYAVGATVPCAIDDRDPRRAYVERGFGGAYLFALIPIPLLALGVWGLARSRRPGD